MMGCFNRGKDDGTGYRPWGTGSQGALVQRKLKRDVHKKPQNDQSEEKY